MPADFEHARSVAVLGAGASGLAAARELTRAGHRVTVLEARHAIGGQCAAAEIDGRGYDLGGHGYSPTHHRLDALVAELGLRTTDTGPPLLFDPSTGRSRPRVPGPLCRETLTRYRRVRAELFPRIADPGLAHSARVLAAPARRWLAEYRLSALAEVFGPGYTAAGYGHLDLDLPALYLVKYAELTGLGTDQVRALDGGFAELWRRVAQELPGLRRGVRVERITRDADGVRVVVDGTEHTFDDLVLAVGLDEVLPVLDATEEERALAARIRRLDLYTTLGSVSGLPPGAHTLVQPHLTGSASRGHCVSFHRRHPDTDVLACHAYGRPDLDGPGVADLLRADVRAWGGQLHRLHLQRRWRFLPHFDSADLAAGALDRLEALQGRRHTYHLGGLPAFELVECVLGYAQDLVRRHFTGLRREVPGHPLLIV
ncbi:MULTISPECIES: FAD-dependent oxidoreductase [unclassified Crossiella]|uniref:FAD-dependent oxidoreductase n=1 Tax=unclassified Crossiella TaxID=2620835 RepID=UPI001FFF64F2|nr:MULTISPECIES: FAD-dependent oxidoreductase [unclassified Crossiella]MCK2243197.1 FAD-dependent oxidoreductase [Crossiella sp. S99.2]MCK2254334.1 FAD-dependent oxidoreductase [Crossiella sp. S99.1]